jgi:hypothetical protein
MQHRNCFVRKSRLKWLWTSSINCCCVKPLSRPAFRSANQPTENSSFQEILVLIEVWCFWVLRQMHWCSLAAQPIFLKLLINLNPVFKFNLQWLIVNETIFQINHCRNERFLWVNSFEKTSVKNQQFFFAYCIKNFFFQYFWNQYHRILLEASK